ncbi:MAG: NADH-quinone oxidoreductase subunit C [Mucilaginibacter sp.]|uniref:NADH-quinone oxidoreductase subunit C n=1 Tax=Mucilaginibacter sp. TaxID=1882438 RepID=UPI0034E48994
MGKISNEEVINQLNLKFGEEVVLLSEPSDLPNFETSREHITDVLSFLKTDPALQFNYLTDITAVHYPDKEKKFAVVYHLHSFVNNVRVRVKVFLDEDDVHIPSATELWNGANWMERETYDYFGIEFDGHPDLRRILNVDDMTVFPMRKEFPLEDPNRVDKRDYFFGR